MLVTGGHGFLGSYVLEGLAARGCSRIIAPRSQEVDLTQVSEVVRLLDETEAELIIHLAAVVGGIGANRRQPGRFFYENLVMGVHLIEEARRRKVRKFVCIGTICAYPKRPPIPFREENLWDGYPEETNAPYGLAKKALLVQLQAYREEYGFNGIYLLPVNLYGPRDDFNLETGHVIPHMVRRFIEARRNGEKVVTLWGDGSPTREFLFVDDAADGILRASEFYDSPDPVNLGTGVEISIKELAQKITVLLGFEGEIRWDSSMPNGQPRRVVDVSRAKEGFGFQAKVHFDEGLRRTVEWYEKELDPGASPLGGVT